MSEQGTAGILSGPEIENAIRRGDIDVSPFDPRNVNPASYDLTLGQEVRVYEDVVWVSDGPGREGEYLQPLRGAANVLDARHESRTQLFKIDPGGSWLLKPGIGYLMHTAEIVSTDKYVPVLDGKSSIGRLFVAIHETAGYGDPGFRGQYTLEVRVTHPVRVYAGMRFCQIRFHTIVGEVRRYGREAGSHYVEQEALGAVPSKAFAMFSRDDDQ